MGLDFTGNMNYQQMQHIDAGAALQNTLRGMVDDRTKSAEMAAKLAQQKKDNVRADANLLLNQNEATRKAQQDEYDMQLKASEMGLTSDYRLADLAAKAEENKNTAAYRKSAQALALKSFNAQRGDVANALAKDEGEAYGESQLLNGEVLDKNPLAEKVLKDKAIAESNRLQDMIGGQPTYAEYRSKIDPTYSTMKIGDNPGILGDVKNFFSQGTYSKDALAKYHKAQNMTQEQVDNMPVPPTPTKIMSKKEYETSILEANRQAKDSIKQWLAGQGDYATEDKSNEQYLRDKGIIVPDTEATVTRDFTKGEIQANNDKLLADYQVSHPKAGRHKLLGVRDGINKNTKKLLEDRDALAKVQLANTIKAFDKQQEYAYKRAIEKYKSELKAGEEVSTLDMTRIAKYTAETNLLDAKTFTEKDK
jgi:hypothetical protein